MKCESNFRCYIKDEPQETGIIIVTWPETAGQFHDIIKKEKVHLIQFYYMLKFKLITFKVKRLTGHERKLTSKNLMIYGNKDVRNKNILLNRDEKGSNFDLFFVILFGY